MASPVVFTFLYKAVILDPLLLIEVEQFSVSRAVKSRVAFAVLANVTAVYAYLRMFTGFSFYDDEGSLILMSRWLLDGHSVYGEFSSVYGPFYFLYTWVIHTLIGGSTSHTAARLIAVVPWVVTCLAVFRYILRITGSRVAALAAWLTVLRALAFFAAEPGHPQEISVLLMVGLLTAAARPSPARLAAVGALVAALLLTKINLGAFAVMALLPLCISALPAARGRNLLLAIAVIICAASPTLLMLPLLSTGWVQVCCALVTLSILPMAAVLAAGRPGVVFGPRHWLALALGFVMCASLVLAWSVGRGASLGAMVQSTVLDNLVQSHTWTAPLHVGATGILAGVAGVILATLWLTGFRNGPFDWLRLAVGGCTVLLVLVGESTAAFVIALPFVWMVMLPSTAAVPLWPRAVLASLTVMQAMIVYPVAGSQLRFMMVPLALVAMVMVYEAWIALGLGEIWSGLRTRRAEHAAIAFLLACYLFTAGRALINYRQLAPLDLVGTSGVHVDSADRGTYHWIVSHARACDALVSFPAMHSVYFWTGKVPPVYPDVDGWQPYANRERQTVERQVLSSPRACVLVIDKLVDFWLPMDGAVQPTLLGFIRDNFAEADRREGFHFLVRKH